MRTIGVALAAFVTVLALAGCDDGKDPDDPQATWTPTGKMETPTPTDDPLTEAPADETAKQFNRRWVNVANRAQATGTSTPTSR